MPIKDDQGKTRGWCFEDDAVVDEIANAGEAFRTSNAGEADVELQHSVQECIGRVVLERTTDQPRPRIKYVPKLAVFLGDHSIIHWPEDPWVRRECSRRACDVHSETMAQEGAKAGDGNQL